MFARYLIEMCMFLTVNFRMGQRQMWMFLAFNFRMGKVNCGYFNGKAVCDFIFVGNSNVCPICHRLWDINSGNVYELNADIWNGLRSNTNKPIERPHAT